MSGVAQELLRWAGVWQTSAEQALAEVRAAGGAVTAETLNTYHTRRVHLLAVRRAIKDSVEQQHA